MPDIFDSIKNQDIFDTLKQEQTAAPVTDELVTELPPEQVTKKEGFFKRLGKQYFNAAAAAPYQTMIDESNIGRAGVELDAMSSMESDFRKRAESNSGVTQKELDWHAKPYQKGTFGSLFGSKRPEWAEKTWNKYQQGQLKVVERTPQEEHKKFLQNMEDAKLSSAEKNSIFLTVSEASGMLDAAADIVGGIGGFVTQIGVLKRAFPQAPPALIWEIQSQLNGGTPGKGALTYAAFAAPGKIITGNTVAAKTTRLLSESGTMAGMSAAEQYINTGEIDPIEVATQAGIPVAFRVPGFIKAGMRLGSKRTKNAIVLYKGGKERVVVTPSDVSKTERIFKQKPETRAERLLGAGEAQKQLPAGKEVKRLPAQTQKALPMTAAEKQSRRSKLNQDRIDNKAKELYDKLLKEGEEGSKKSQKKISDFIQGQNLPTLESLYEKVNAGDEIAAQMIQEGLYSGSPEAFIEGFRVQAAKELKIPYDVNKLKNRWAYVEGGEGMVQKGEIVPRTYGHNQPVPEPQMNIFRTDGGRIITDETALEVRKSRKRSKKFPFGYEVELFDPSTGERAIPAPELTRGMRETEGQYKQRVYGVPEKPVVEGAVTREPRLQPGVTHERGAEALPPGARQLPGGETMVSSGEAVSPERPVRTAEPTPKSAPARENVAVAKPIKFETSTDTAEAKLRDWTPKAKKMNKQEIKEAQKKLRMEQAEAGKEQKEMAKSRGESISNVLRAIKRGFKKKMIRPEIEPPDLTPNEWDSLSAKINKVHNDNIFHQNTAQTALDHLRFDKRVPTPYELGVLEPILGTGTVTKLYEAGVKSHIYTLGDVPRLVRDGLKSTFGYDFQAVRQLRGIALRHPVIYAKSVAVNAATYFSKSYSDKIAKEIQDRPSWKFGQEMGVNYLGTKPWTAQKGQRLQQYGDFSDFLLSRKATTARAWGRWLRASERGANLGIDVGLQQLVEQAMKQGERLAKKGVSLEKIDAFYKQRARDINAFTKRVTAKTPQLRTMQEAANWVLFSPAHTVSRPIGTWRSIANLFKSTPANRTYAMQLTLSNIASIHAMGSIFAWLGHKYRMQNPLEEPIVDGTNNPTDSMWGKGRIGKDVFDMSGGDVSWYRTIARIGVSAYYYAKEKAGGERQTEFMGRPLSSAGEEFMRYLTSRETVVLGLGKTLLTGKDWLGRPIERKNALLKAIPFETLISLIEAGQADGLWEAMAEGDYSEASKDALATIPIGVAGLLGAGTMSYPVPAAATRSSYRDIIAMEEHDRQWDELTPIEQKKLELKHRKEFKNFESLIAKERVETPINIEKIIADEKAAGDRIRSKLTPDVRAKLEEVPLNLSRRPKDFYLNDRRNNRYEQLIVEYLGERLSKTKSENVTVLKSIVESAKTKAWLQLKKEIRAEE